jgi:Protein of unknown function (DUF732)
MTFGNKDLAAASDGDLLRLGKVVCDGLGIEGLGVGQVIQRLVQSEARPTTTEARAFVRSAVRNLCPAHAIAIGCGGCGPRQVRGAGRWGVPRVPAVTTSSR